MQKAVPKESLAMPELSIYQCSMQTPLVMTVVGQDRPGLIEAVARIVGHHGGNWLESRMCRLGGEFAGILRVNVPAENKDKFVQSLGELKSEGLTVVVQPDVAMPQKAGSAASLTLVGQDRPGIVREISHVIARHGVNIEELETECSSAPMSGEMLFSASARLFIPQNCEVANLRADLELIAADLQVEIRFEKASENK
ncbi:MAG: glycine cleavage system protein R [Verrucomicrobiia bacterium]